MSLKESQEQIKKFYEYARTHGFSDRMFLTNENLDRFVETAIDKSTSFKTYQKCLNPN